MATRRAVKPVVVGDTPLSLEMAAVDAATAKDWLSVNASNRQLRKRKLFEYKRDMLAGNWRAVGDPIRFDTNGDMIDGQHRLMALVSAEADQPGITVMFIVVRGVAPEDRVVIDIGTRRSAGDQLKIAGFQNSALLAAAAKWAMLFERSQMSADVANKSVTHAEILDFCEKNPRLIECVGLTSSQFIKKVDMPGGYIATSYYLCSKKNKRDADEFFDKLASGAGLEKGDPILSLRSRLRELARPPKTQLSGEMWLSLVLRTWNAKREGKTIRALPVHKAGVPIAVPDIK